MNVRTVNPATGAVLAEYGLLTPAELERALAEGHAAFPLWRDLSLAARAGCVHTLENALMAAREVLAGLITEEMGKVRKEALAEVSKCVSACQALRAHFPAWKAECEYRLPSGHSVHREPLGLILGVMPWNFPVWQVIRFAVPALLCGNTVILKHAPNTWGTAEFLGDLFRQAFPFAVYNNLKIDVSEVSRLIADPRVRGVSLTGSRRAGAAVGRAAGEHLKKCVLELGGSDAYIVLDDADLDLAAQVCTQARLLNAGQSCIAAKRFIVTRRNAEGFTQRFKACLERVRMGDPSQTESDIGPLARTDLRDQLHEQVRGSVARGAVLRLGGQIPSGPGFYYPPTLLTGVRPGQPAFDEELFGPVAAVIEAADESEAIALANQSHYGLGCALFSRDIERARALGLRDLEAGMIFVNDHVKSDPLVPFGGIKDSGLGRELGRDGALEFTNIKVVYSPV